MKESLKKVKSNSWKQQYDPKNLRALNYQHVKLKAELLSDEDRSDIKQPTQLKQLNLNEISKPLSIEIPRNDFISLIKDVFDNLGNKDFQTTVYLLKIIIKEISRNEALELYNSLIKPDVDTLKNALSIGKNRRNNILAIPDNIKSSLFDNVYLHYQDKSSETEGNTFRKNNIKKTKI